LSAGIIIYSSGSRPPALSHKRHGEMKSLSKVVLVLLTVTALSAAVVSPAAAAAPEPQLPALTCADGACQLVGNATGLAGFLRGGANLALTQLPFEPSADGGVQAALDIKKDITLSLPVGEVVLTNAELQVEVGEDGKIKRLNGAADMPSLTFGLLDDVRVLTPARANVGLDLGKNLPDTGFELAPERSYLFFYAVSAAAAAADTAMNVTARTSEKAEAFSLAFAPGQRAILVIDTVDPVAYLDGHVTLSGIDQIALLGRLLERTPVAEYVPDTLPLRERTQFGLSGKFSKNLAESRLILSGAYLLDAGILPARLGIEAQPLNLQGELTVSRDGVWVDGVLKSAIEPDKLFNGGARVVMFLPVSKVAGPGYVDVDASVKVPAVNMGVRVGAKAGVGKYELSGQVSTPFTDSDPTGNVSGDLPDVAGAVGPVVGRAAGAVGSAAGTVGSVAGRAAGDVGATAGKATAAVGTGAGKAAGFVGPVASRAAGVLSGYARSGLGLAGNAIVAGKAKLSRDATATATPTPVIL
jgi:hypothetical protein